MGATCTPPSAALSRSRATWAGLSVLGLAIVFICIVSFCCNCRLRAFDSAPQALCLVVVGQAEVAMVMLRPGDHECPRPWITLRRRRAHRTTAPHGSSVRWQVFASR